MLDFKRLLRSKQDDGKMCVTTQFYLLMGTISFRRACDPDDREHSIPVCPPLFYHAQTHGEGAYRMD